MCCEGRDREAGVVVDELEDDAGPAAGEDVVGRVQLPAGVRCRIDEPAVGGPRFLPRATPACRKIRASAAVEGTGSIPSVRIRSWTLIGPWSSPDCSNAARTRIASWTVASVTAVGVRRGRRDRGSSTAAGPSAATRFRIS